MIKPGRYDIGADRWVACIRTFALIGVNLTGATFIAQVRAVPDGGSALVSLTTVGSMASEGLTLVYAGSDTVAAHIAAGRINAEQAEAAGLATTDTVDLTLVGMRINETTMEGLPFPGSGVEGERGDEVALVWDMHITPLGGIKDKYLGGAFTVRPGATQ